jgi:outer membrane immunogenic protein
MLKQSLLCAAVLCGSSGAGHAVDLLASESVAYDKNWGGSYVGVSIGYGSGRTETTYDQGDDDHWGAIAMDPDGFAFSATAGYNIQHGRLVYGVEGDLGYIDLSDSGQMAWDGHYLKSNVGSFWGTLRARAGYSVDRMLVYGTGGVAFMNFDEHGIGDNGNYDQNSDNDETKWGWTLGVGAEYAFTPRLSGKVEYLHMDFGENGGHRRRNNGGDCSWTFDNEVDLLRVGLNYKIGRSEVMEMLK